MKNITKYAKNTSLDHVVLVCNHCGNYILKNDEVFQLCHCMNILVLGGMIQPDIQLITDCKMCSLLAIESSS